MFGFVTDADKNLKFFFLQLPLIPKNSRTLIATKCIEDNNKNCIKKAICIKM